LGDILGKRADICLANALSWREKGEKNGMIEDLRKMRTHVGVALSMFLEVRDVG
jgi:hypothetical protein